MASVACCGRVTVTGLPSRSCSAAASTMEDATMASMLDRAPSAAMPAILASGMGSPASFTLSPNCSYDSSAPLTALRAPLTALATAEPGSWPSTRCDNMSLLALSFATTVGCLDMRCRISDSFLSKLRARAAGGTVSAASAMGAAESVDVPGSSQLKSLGVRVVDALLALIHLEHGFHHQRARCHHLSDELQQRIGALASIEPLQRQLGIAD